MEPAFGGYISTAAMPPEIEVAAERAPWASPRVSDATAVVLLRPCRITIGKPAAFGGPMDIGKDPPHGFARVLALKHSPAPPAPVELSAATSDMFDSPQERGLIVTCPKSCRRPVLAQPPNSSGPKNKEAGKPADYVFRAARPRPARVRVPVKLAARPRSPCLRASVAALNGTRAPPALP